MRRIRLVIAGLVVCTAACAQVAVTSSGYATLQGPAVQNALPSPPLLTTPIVDLGTASPNPVGATNATAANVAGATNGTLSMPTFPSSASMIMALPLDTENPAQVQADDENCNARAPQVINLGPAQFSSAYSPQQSQASGSMGEAAHKYRQARETQNPRLYTNDDVVRMNQATGTGATSPLQRGTQPPRTLPQPGQAPPQNPVPAAPPTAPPPRTMTENPQLQLVAQVTTEGSQPSNNDSGQSNQKGTPQPNANAGQELPGTSSNLPLIALLGIVTGFAGILCRRAPRD